MRKEKWFVVVIVLLLLAAGAAVAQAQANGSIRGMIYQDTNADGICGVGDPVLSGVPVEFAPDGGQAINLVSGNDGSYGLVAAGYGTWRVTAKPTTGQVTSVEKTRVIVLSAERPVVEGVNFCVNLGTSSGGGGVLLPESGAALPPTLLVAAILGVALLILGMGLIVRDRRTAG